MESTTSCTNIKVAIRMRPFIPSEEDKKLSPQWAKENNIIYQIDESGQQCGESYFFDHIFGIEKTNKEIYDEIVKDFVISSMNGLNTTIFAYGQTSSGKTYTMLGDKNNSGVMTLAVDNIFDIIEENISRKYLIRVSYIEIYNEKINDLLDPKNRDLKIREFGPQNLKEEIVSRKEQMYNCLKTGNSNRHIGSTKANERSSRSHTIFKITIESTQANDLECNNNSVQISSINLVDLAGSERVAQTKATGMRLIEGGHINKSLSALGLVIRQLSDNQEFVNFRDSKLTRLLQDSLGGNSKTLIIATITLASIDDTNSTLAFAQRAKAVKNKPRVNEILSDAELKKRYANLNDQLKQKLEQQVLINQQLQRTQEENVREMARLQQQIEMIEDFHHGSKTPKSQSLPKRRHTIGFSTQKKKLFSSPSERRTFGEGNFLGLNTILEDSPEKQTESGMNSKQCIARRNETPEELLRTRLEKLEEDYTELVTYTRDENNILNEATEKAEEFESRFRIAEKELEHYRLKFKQVEESSIKKSEVSNILDELLTLQSILRNVKFQNECCENSGTANIESFYFKIKASRDLIQKAILKCLHNDCDDTYSFQDHSSILNDFPFDLTDNLKQEIIEDFKTLTEIYESLKNQSKSAPNTSNYSSNEVGGNETLDSEMKSFMNGTNTEVSGSVFDFNDRHNSTLKNEEKNLESSPLEENLIQQNIELKKEIDKLRLQYDLLQTDFELLKTETELEVKSETQPQEFGLLTKQNESLQKELATIKLQHIEEINKLNDSLEKLNIRIRDIQKEKENILHENCSLNNENAAHKKEIEELKQNLQLLEQTKNKLMSLEGQNSELNERLHSELKNSQELQNEIQKIQTENLNLKLQLKELQSERELNINQWEEKIKQVSQSLQQELATVKEQHLEEKNKLNDSLEELNITIRDIQKEYKNILLENSSLNCENAAHKKEIEELKQSLQLLEQSDIKSDEIAKNKLVSLEDENFKINERLHSELKNSQELQNEIQRIKTENLHLKLQLEEFQTERELNINQWEEKIKQATQSLQQQLATVKEQHIEEKNKLNDALEKRDITIRDIQKENENILHENSSLNCENAAYKKEVEEVKQRLQFLEQSNIKSDEIAKNKLMSLEDENSKLNERLLSELKNIQELQNEIQKIQKENVNLKLQLEKFKTERELNMNQWEEKFKQAQSELEDQKVLLKKFEEVSSENDSLKAELEGMKNKPEDNKIEAMKNELLKHEEQYRADQIKIRELESKVKFQKGQISNAQKQIVELTSTFERNDKKYKKELMQLESKLSNIVSKEHEYNFIAQKLEKTKIKKSTLKESLKNLEKAFQCIIGLIISEQESVLQVRLSQEYRDRFKHILKNLKILYSQLQNQLKMLTHQQPYDIEVIIKCLTHTKKLVGEFYNEEKLILKNNMKNLEVSNEGYIQEIIVLRENQSQHKHSGCPQCLLLQSEITKLKEIVVAQKSKNVLLEKENIDRENNSKTFNQQDSKNMSLLQACDRNKKTLEEQKGNSKSVQVQCDILSKKYEVMKQLYQSKKDEAKELKSQIRELNSK